MEMSEGSDWTFLEQAVCCVCWIGKSMRCVLIHTASFSLSLSIYSYSLKKQRNKDSGRVCSILSWAFPNASYTVISIISLRNSKDHKYMPNFCLTLKLARSGKLESWHQGALSCGVMPRCHAPSPKYFAGRVYPVLQDNKCQVPTRAVSGYGTKLPRCFSYPTWSMPPVPMEQWGTAQHSSSALLLRSAALFTVYSVPISKKSL